MVIAGRRSCWQMRREQSDHICHVGASVGLNPLQQPEVRQAVFWSA